MSSQPIIAEEISNYIQQTKFAVLTYVRHDLTPISRAMGSFALDGNDLIFSTRRDAGKVGEIGRHRRVSFFFEHDNQAPDTWKNVLLIGEAEPVTGGPDLDTAVAQLSARSPRFRERAARGELSDTAIFRIRTREIEYLDRSAGYGAVQKIHLVN
jgi:pyridoxamine 5'-phosphate oxidase